MVMVTMLLRAFKQFNVTLDNHPCLAPYPASTSEQITIILSPNPSNPRTANCNVNQVLEMMTHYLPLTSQTSTLSHILPGQPCPHTHPYFPSQPRVPTQSRRPAQARDLCVASQAQVEPQTFPSPPPTRSNSISRHSVDEAEKSYHPGDEMVGLMPPSFYKLTDSQVDVEYDLLKRYHHKNKSRRPPSPTYLDSVRSNGTGKYKKARRDSSKERSRTLDPQFRETNDTTQADRPAQNQPSCKTGRWSINPKGKELPKATTLAFYPPLWQKVLNFAKAKMQLYVAVENAFPALAEAINGPCSESLLEALACHEDDNIELEAGKSYIFHCLQHPCIFMFDRYLAQLQTRHG